MPAYDLRPGIEYTEELSDHFRCGSCGVDTFSIGEYYMILDELWKIVSPDNFYRFLCIACVEDGLGRVLTSKDFTSCPVNYLNMLKGSQKIIHRMTHRY